MIHLTRMLYLSTASPSLTDDDLEAILKQSRDKNQRLNITGVLYSGGDHFTPDALRLSGLQGGAEP